jgi:hypothetical protein
LRDISAAGTFPSRGHNTSGACGWVAENHVFVLLEKLERMAPVKKIIGLLLLAAFICGTAVGCGSPTTKAGGGGTTPTTK